MNLESDDRTASIAAAHKVLILATAIALIDVLLIQWMWIAVVAFPVVVWAGWKIIMLTETRLRWLWIAALVVPVFTPLAAIILSDHATRYLKARGHRVYALGLWDPGQRTYSITAIALLALFVAAISFLWATAGKLSWTEEVRLSNGKTIVIHRTNRYADVAWTRPASSGLFERARLAFSGPGPLSSVEDWDGSAQPLILDVREGKAYVVAIITSYSGVKEFGKPDPGYVAFVFSGDAWQRIDLKKLPAGLSVDLLVLPREDLIKTQPVSISAKERANARASVPDEFRRLKSDYRLRY